MYHSQVCADTPTYPCLTNWPGRLKLSSRPQTWDTKQKANLSKKQSGKSCWSWASLKDLKKDEFVSNGIYRAGLNFVMKIDLKEIKVVSGLKRINLEIITPVDIYREMR